MNLILQPLNLGLKKKKKKKKKKRVRRVRRAKNQKFTMSMRILKSKMKKKCTLVLLLIMFMETTQLLIMRISRLGLLYGGTK